MLRQCIENGTRSASARNLRIKALGGGSIHPVRNIKVASRKDWTDHSFQKVLCTILGTRRLTDEVWNTNFCMVEYALKARPLTPVSAGEITPNHFLLGYQATGIPSIVGVDEFDHRKGYARAQSYANAIWARWI